jgi:hypothetical protein
MTAGVAGGPRPPIDPYANTGVQQPLGVSSSPTNPYQSYSFGGAGRTPTDPYATSSAPPPSYGQQQLGDARANTAPVSGSTATRGTQQLLNQTLIDLLGQDPNNVSVNDPSLRPQAEAYRFARERAARGQQEQLAEGLGAQGLGRSGAMDAGRMQIGTQMGQDVAGYEAGLVGQELQGRRGQIVKALELGRGIIGDDMMRQLQMELANIDAAIRGRGLDIQDKLGTGDLDLRGKLGTGGLNLGLLGLLLGDRHFNSNLGFQVGATQAALNNQALASLMGIR